MERDLLTAAVPGTNPEGATMLCSGLPCGRRTVSLPPQRLSSTRGLAGVALSGLTILVIAWLGILVSPVSAAPLPIKVKRITDGAALLEYRGANGLFTKGDERYGVFRIVDVLPDRVIVFSIADQAEQTFVLGGASPDSTPGNGGPAGNGSAAGDNEVITSPGGKGGFKIVGIIGGKKGFSAIVEKGGVQMNLSAGQTVEGMFTVKDVRQNEVVLFVIPENLTGTFMPGNIILGDR